MHSWSALDNASNNVNYEGYFKGNYHRLIERFETFLEGIVLLVLKTILACFSSNVELLDGLCFAQIG